MSHLARVVAGLLAGAVVPSLAAQPFLVGNLNSTPDRAGSFPAGGGGLDGVVQVGDRLFFPADDGVHGRALWVTDGTEAGTYLVRDFPAGLTSYGSFEGIGLGDRLIFNASETWHGSELWVSDGTEEGTRLIRDFQPGPAFGQPQFFATLHGFAYFRVNDAEVGNELFKTDGSVAGTSLVRDIYPGPDGSFGGNASRPVPIGDILLFGATSAEFGEELWRTDGTADGTFLVRDIAPGPSASSIARMTPWGGLVFFTAFQQGGGGLWRSDGTLAGTTRLSVEQGAALNLTAMVAAPFGVLFAANGQGFNVVGRSDGTQGGTFVLAPATFCSTSGTSSMAATANGAIFVNTDASGCEVWFTDGTPDGTGRLIDIVPGPTGSMPREFSSVPGLGLAFFVANAVTGPARLWRSDGTVDGTFPLTSFSEMNSIPIRSLIATSDALYFAASDGVHGRELWVSDGTVKGTRLVKDIRASVPDGPSNPAGYVRAGESVYFAASTPATGLELWRTDARPNSASTRLVRDINPGAANGTAAMSAPSPLGETGSVATAVGERLYFRATEPATGSELWVTDGTTDGTRRVTDIIPGVGSSSPLFLTPLGDTLIFSAFPVSNAPRSIFRSDGTPEGTTQLRPTCVGGNCASFAPGGFVRYHDHVYFSYYEPSTGSELWRTGGAADGSDTTIIELRSGPAGGTPAGLTVVNDALIFSATGSSVRELWISRGTPETTERLSTVRPIGTGGSPGEVSTGARAFFAGETDGFGVELWVTDATPEGTRMVRDISAGNASTSMRLFTVSGDRLYFVASDGSDAGHELWTSDGTAKGTHMVADLLQDNANIEDLGPTNLAAAPDGRVVFTVPSADRGYEMWISDGSQEGTRPLLDINPGEQSSWPETAFLFNRTLLFSAYEPGHHRELWGYRFAGGECPCDWDFTGIVDSRDFFEFLADFFNLAADFDGSGGTNSSDFFSFLACFFEKDCK